MLSRVFADYQQNPLSGQYVNMGDQRLSVTRSAVNEDILIFDNNGFIRSVLIKNSGAFVYQIRKKHINAIGGAAGLYEFLKKEIEQTSTGGFYLTVCNKVFDYMN